MNVEITMLIMLNDSPRMAIQPCTTYQLRNIGRKARIDIRMFLKESSSTTNTKTEEMINAMLKSL